MSTYKTFSSVGLGDSLVAQISAVGFRSPTPIQGNCIPPILEGKLTVCLFLLLLYTHFCYYVRQRLYWVCKDWKWENSSFCASYSPQTL